MDSSLQDADPRIEASLTALEANPDDRAAFDELVAAYREGSRWDELLRFYEREASRLEEGSGRAGIYLEAGKVWHEHVGNPQQAMRHYQLAFRADPHCVPALAAARTIYGDLANWDMVARLLTLEIEAQTDARARAELLYQLGQVALEHFGDARHAGECFEQALASDPNHNGAMEALAALTSERENWRATADELAALADSTSDPTEQASLLLRVAELYHREERGSPQVEAYVTRALESDPVLPEALRLWSRVLEEQGRYEELSNHLAHQIATSAEPAHKAELQCRLARLAVNVFGNDEAAEGYYREVLAIDPVHPEALAVLLRGMRLRREGPQALALADQALEAAPADDVRTMVLREAGEMAWKEVGDRERAERYLAQLRELAPSDPLCLEFFREPAAEDQDWKSRYTALSRAARKQSDPARKRETFREVARLAEERLGKPKDAIDAWRSVLELDPRDSEARERLKRLYRQAERWHALVELLKGEIELLPPEQATEKIALFQETASIYGERLKMEPMVVNTLHSVLHVDPRHRPTLEKLAAIYERRQSWGQLADILGRKAEATDEPNEKLELLHRSAEIWLARLQSPEDAIRRYEEILEVNPTDAAALEALRKVYEQRRAYEPLVRVYLREIDILEDDDAKRARAREVAEWASKHLHRPARLIELWNKVLQFDDRDVRALQGLAALYEREERWQPLAEVLDRQLQETADPRHRVQLMRRLGQVWADRLDQEARALELWEQALELEPDNGEVFKILRDRYVRARQYDSLEELYAKREKWEEYVDVLVVQAESNTDPEEKAQVYFKIAGVWEERLGRQDRAARVYERILELDPQNLPAARALRPMYEEHAEWRKLAQVEEVLALAAPTPAERAAGLRQVAFLHEEHLRRPDLALRYVAQAFPDDPADPAATAELVRLAEATEGWLELAGAYEAAHERTEDPELGIELALRAARLHDGKLGQTPEAIAAYERVRAEDPGHVEATEALTRLYRVAERWHELDMLLQHRVSTTDQPQLRLELLFELATIQEQQLQNPIAAIETFRSILDESGEDARALRALAYLYEQTEQKEKLAEVLGRLLHQAENPAERADLLRRLGRLLIDQDPLAAVERFRQLLEIEPEHPGAVIALEELMAGSGARAEAARLLIERYEARADWNQAVPAYRALIGETEEIDERVELLLTLARILEQELHLPEEACDTYARAFSEDPGDPRTHESFERIAVLLDREAQLTEAILAVADRIDDRAYRARLTFRAATLLAELDRAEEALVAFGNVLEIGLPDDDARQALRIVARLHESREDWGALLETLARSLELGESAEERKELLLRRGALFEERLGNADAAIQTYRDILILDPDDDPALDRLDVLYLAGEDWERLTDILASKIRRARSPEERADLHCRLGQVFSDQLNRTTEALEEYRAAVENDPEREDAVSAIEALVEQEPHLLVLASETLAPVYERRGDLDKVSAALEAILPSRAPADRVQILHRVATMAEEGGNLERAYDAYLRALGEEPADVETRRRLGRLCDSLGRWPNLLERLEELLERMQPEDRVAALSDMASAAEDRLGELERAIGYFEQVLELDREHEATLDGLEGLYARTARWNDLAELLTTRLASTDDPELSRDLAVRAGEVYEMQLERNEEAIASYERAESVVPADPRVLDALERLYLGSERWEELVRIYLKRADLIDEPERSKQVLFASAGILEKELGSADRAVQVYRRISDSDPTDRTALEALVRLYDQIGDAEELLGSLTLLHEVTLDPGERLDIQHRIGKLHQGPLDNTARAIETYREIIAAAPEHEPTVAALEELLDGPHRLAAARVLAPLHAGREAWTDLIRVTEIQLQESEDLGEKVDLLHRVGRTREVQLGERELAFEAYREALRWAPENERTIRELERLTSEDSRFEELATVYEETLADLADPDAAKGLALKVARIYDNVLADREGAIERYKRVLAYAPEAREPLAALERLYEATANWVELALILGRRLEITTDHAEAIQLHHRLGSLLGHRLDDAAAAVSSFAAALSLDADHTPSVQELEALAADRREVAAVAEILAPRYRTRGDWTKLGQLYDIQAEVSDAPSERKRIFREIARLQEEQIGSWDLAFASLARALREDPADAVTLEELFRLADLSASWEELAALLEEEQEKVEEDGVRELLGIRVAGIFETHLQNETEAARRYQALVDQSPRNLEALEALDRLYGRLQAWPALAEVLRLQVDAATETDSERDFLLRLAGLLEHELDQVGEAISIYRQVLDRESRHRGALAALRRIYSATEQSEELYWVHEQRLEIAVDENGRAEVLAEMARLAAAKLGRVEDAIDLWIQVLDTVGENDEALGALQDLYERTERYNEMCEVLGRRSALAADPQQSRIFLSRRAHVYAEQLGRDEEAVESWRAVLEHDPQNLEALLALKGLYQRSQRFPELEEILAQATRVGAAQGIDATSLADLYVEMARVQGDVLMRTAAAIDSWHQVLELSPGHRESLDALEKLYEEQEAWPECAEILEQRIAVSEDDDRIEALHQAAALYDRRLNLPERAIDLYLEVIGTRPAENRANEALEALYERLNRFEQLAELLLNRLETAEDAYSRVELLRRIAQVYLDRLGRADMAFIVLCRAVREDPRDEKLLAQVERLARDTGSFEELALVFEDMVATITDREMLLSLHATVARYYAEDLLRPDHAVGHYRRMLSLDEDHHGALSALEVILRREGRLPELADILRRKAALAVELGEKKANLFDLATLCEEHLNNPTEAARALQEIVQFDEQDAVALDALARIYRQEARWRDLIDILRSKIHLAETQEEVLGLRQQIAAILDRELDDPNGAAEEYREILTVEPDRAYAHENLERILTLQRRWDELVDLLSGQIAFAQGPNEEIALQEKIAALWEEQLGHAERAIESYRAILRIEPRHHEALEALERLYDAQGRWRDLADILERRANAARLPDETVSHLKRLGDVYEHQLGDHGQAAGAYQRILELQSDDADALVALAGIYEAAGDYAHCVDSLERAAHVGEDRRQTAQAWHRVAVLAHERLNDLDRSETALRHALSADPTYLPALTTLKEHAGARGDWKEALALLQKEEEQTFDRGRKVDLFCEMGKVASEQLGDPLAAARFYELALEKDRHHLPAARPLADLYFERGEPEKARELLEFVVEQADQVGLSGRNLALYQHRLATVTEKAGDEQSALRYYRAAYDEDLTYLPTLLSLGDLLFRRQEWDEAFRVYQSLVVHHSDAEGVDLVDIYYRLGVIRHHLGERRKAIHSFDKALELRGEHLPSLHALARVYEESDEWEESIEVRRRLVEALSKPQEKLEAAITVGDLYRDKLKNHTRAVDAFVDALDLAPGNLIVLHKLLEMHTESRQWDRAIEVLDQISTVESDPEKLATYYYSVAVIYRDEIKDHEKAIAYFNKTLDANPMRLKAFEGVDKLLTQQRDWQALADNYVKMLERVPAGSAPKLQVMLWRNLGEIYRTRLRRFSDAIPCFQEAAKLTPDDMTLHVILSELYEESPETLDDAIHEHRTLLGADPLRFDSYHALHRIYRTKQDHERAYRICQSLEYLGKLEVHEHQYQERLRPQAPKRPARALDERLWQAVLHPASDRLLGRIFAYLTPGVAQTYLMPPKDLGVRKKDRIDTTNLDIFFTRIFQLTRGVLGVHPPEVFLKAEGHMGLTLMNTSPVTLLVGPDMVQDRPEQELAFALGKQLSYLRPEHFLTAVLPPLVETIFYAGVKACYPTQKLPEHVDRRQIEDLGQRVEKALPPAALAQLRELLQQYFQTNARFDPATWKAAVELTGNRAGLVVCNDLRAADKVIQQEPVAISQVPRADKLRDLLRYSVSEEYFALRKNLGMGLKIQ